MDDLSAEELRAAATTANLRRAFGVPAADPMPPVFAALLRRLSERERPRPPRLPGVLRPEA